MVNVIAEFCQNHNGDKTILQEMIHAAAENGASHAKIQTIFAEDLAKREEFESGKVQNGVVQVIKRPFEPEYERLKKLELSYEVQNEFIGECEKRGMVPLTTCFTRGSVGKIREIGFKHIKVASYDCGSFPLIKDLANSFENIIVSTGATYDHEIEKTARILKDSGKDYSFLHCVTIYPTPLDEIHLARMEYLKRFAPEVGLSEHTHALDSGVKASIGAIYHGAKWIERHFTVLDRDQTKDGPVSIDPAQLKEIVDFGKMSKDDQKQYIKANVLEYNQMIGSPQRTLSHTELLNRAYYRGRFATHVNGEPKYNWEDGELWG